MAGMLRTYLDFATETAFLAGRLTLGYFQTPLQPEMKPDDSPVTIADQRAEELIRRRIEQAFPRHAIVGEEYGATSGSDNATHRWYIDPIDGTKSFVRGVPLYAVLIALEIEGQVEVGAAYFPALGEMLAAARGHGCTWNGRPARVSTVKELSRATVAHADTASFAIYNRGAQWERLQAATYYRAGWCDCYGYLLVATGRVEVMLDPLMNSWDSAPFLPILQEAGGYFGDWRGNPTIHAGEALATTPELLPHVLRLLGSQTGQINI